MDDKQDETTTLTTVGAKRLLKLAKFLQSMPREKFDFRVVMDIGGKSPMAALKAGHHRCGTVGCAVGWMPAVFPKELKWSEFGDVLLGKSIDFNAAREFFGISNYDSHVLFSPSTSGLGNDATPKAVARHIRKFVKQRYTGKAKLNFA